jgi:tetratricopeptide (TPR) repeat protein
MRKDLSYLFSFIVLIIMAIVFSSLSAYGETCEHWVAKVVSVQGSVEVQREGETQWNPAELNARYCAGDTIRVLDRSRAAIALVNHPVLRLDQNSTITLGGVKEERTSVIDLLSGAAHFFSRVARNLEVRTATVNAGVEGTEFFIRADDDETLLSIFEGKVLASNKSGSLPITTGQSAIVETGKAPIVHLVARPRDAVQWALYYPPVIYHGSASVESYPDGDWQAKVQKSIDLLRAGDITGAFKSIEGVPEESQAPTLLAYRASLLLMVGRVDEADADMRRALELDPDNSESFALQSIIALTQNDRDRAIELAEKAVEADPSSSAALIAYSYSQQERFDLESALSSVKNAVRQDPQNAMAWARLSEIQQSFGRLDESLEAAKKAVELSPELSRTQTVLGFAHLTQVQTEAAEDSFKRAIETDQADPLPRLGLGLTLIRRGDLEEGRREIEIAMSLDADNSLIRSYLGKAYFEEKRADLDGPQFDFAKDLDPQDPTPWFYDAIRKQTINRPVEALHDLQKAIELNDNRAVYRSRLLLDSDLAARSASLGRIFTDLGFQELALVEGWKSVNTDPSNYSAHRFLADSYSVRPRHEIARVSELLQSQLLQPLSISPVQPRLGESNLFLINSGGPAGLSFNEYNPIFNRDQVTLQVSGSAGENSTHPSASARLTLRQMDGGKTPTRTIISSMPLRSCRFLLQRAFRLN